MKEEIKAHLNSPQQLEKLFRENKVKFKKDFYEIYPGIQDSIVAQIWHARLSYEADEISFGTRTEVIVVIIASLLAGAIAKMPFIFSINEEFFVTRNIGLIIFPALILYFSWKRAMPLTKIIISFSIMIISAFYINLLPDAPNSDTLILACIHLPLFLWSVLGFTFVHKNARDLQKRLEFLRYNGDLVVMTTLILISGGLLSAVTLGLFDLIGLRIEVFYFENIAIWGLAAAPVVGTFLVCTNPQLVNKVSPVIAKVFTPLVLVMLMVYLGAIIFTGKDPYNDREFLLIFNLLLIGVMAIIFFSIAETSRTGGNTLATSLLLALSLITILVNGIALSAILFRIAEWGITPNRLAVLGGNILILINLVAVSLRLFTSIRNRKEIEKVENAIAGFLPIYTLWTMIIIFLFPLLFSFN